ncbi:MAG: hypothetical protein ACW991_00350, partial [Candidatus Hodarchaeales archaeon]
KTSFPHLFIELNVSWIRNVKKRTIFGIAELTKEGKIEALSEKNFEAFLSHPNSDSGISMLDFLISRNQINLNDVGTNLRNIGLDLCQEVNRKI